MHGGTSTKVQCHSLARTSCFISAAGHTETARGIKQPSPRLLALSLRQSDMRGRRTQSFIKKSRHRHQRQNRKRAGSMALLCAPTRAGRPSSGGGRRLCLCLSIGMSLHTFLHMSLYRSLSVHLCGPFSVAFAHVFLRISLVLPFCLVYVCVYAVYANCYMLYAYVPLFS